MSRQEAQCLPLNSRDSLGGERNGDLTTVVSWHSRARGPSGKEGFIDPGQHQQKREGLETGRQKKVDPCPSEPRLRKEYILQPRNSWGTTSLLDRRRRTY